MIVSLGGGSGRRTTSQPRKRAKTEPKKHDEILDNITKIFVMPLNGDNSFSVVSRTMIVFNSSFLMTVGRWVHQPLEEIGLLVAIEDDVVRDLYWCVVLKFLSDLLLATSFDVVMTV